LGDARVRMLRYLHRRGRLDEDDDDDRDERSEATGLAHLAAAACDGSTPPAGPAWRRGALPVGAVAKDFERHLSVGSFGFTLHAATRAGAQDTRGRETLLEYVLRPP